MISIYKIFCKKTGLVYFGYTRNDVMDVFRKYINNYNSYKKNKKISYSTFFKIFDNGDSEIEILEQFDNILLIDLKNKKRKMILGAGDKCVNKIIPGRKIKEYLNDNKLVIRDKKHSYYMNNKLKYRKKIQCECGVNIYQSSLRRHLLSKMHLSFEDDIRELEKMDKIMNKYGDIHEQTHEKKKEVYIELYGMDNYKNKYYEIMNNMTKPFDRPNKSGKWICIDVSPEFVDDKLFD